MTREQVEALLGKSNLDVGEFEFVLVQPRDIPGARASYWRGEGGDILAITFHGNLGLLDMTWNNWQDDRNDLEKLRDRILPGKKPPLSRRSSCYDRK